MAYIGMGANLESRAGTPAETLAAASERLQTLGHLVMRSSLYLTEPVGYVDQSHFTNAVVALETEVAPAALLRELMTIEKEFGRDRTAGIVNGPRTLDLDVLLLGDLKLHEAHLDIPHPRLAERAFVLIPLVEIAPDIQIPGNNASAAELLEKLRSSSRDELSQVERIASETWQPGRIKG